MYTTFRFLSQFSQSPEGKLWETPPSAPASGDTGASASQPAIPAAPALAAATPAASQPPATGGSEDRSNWVPPYRLRETRESALREAQSQFAAREAEARAEAERYRTQLHALVGVQPPQNPEVAAVRNQFGQLYPGLSKLEERAADLMGLIERAGDLESQTTHYWQTYGQQTMNQVFDKVGSALGSPLNDEAKRALHTSFVGFVSSSPEMTNRYASDPTIVDDFVRVFTSSFIDPARRVATAGTVGRAFSTPGIPQDTPGGVPRTTPVPQPANLDERVGGAWARYNQLTQKV